MKRMILFISAFLLIVSVKAQSLEANASYIRKNYESDYEATIKKHALEEWNDDFNMVVYEINKQADALAGLIEAFKPENTNIAYKAIQEWSIEGYLDKNIDLFKELEVFGLKGLLKLHCDWNMVKYEYDKQVKAKNAF